ncbi:MAG: hypothetical protein V1915_01685 [Candidatus Bathyarchaeota archaeon]
MEIRQTYTALPFLISLGGVIADYISTNIGLGLGFYETHAQYNPVYALLIFWGALTLLTVTLPKRKIWEMTKTIFAAASFLGFVNNTLVISGFFSGLII